VASLVNDTCGCDAYYEWYLEILGFAFVVHLWLHLLGSLAAFVSLDNALVACM
jgi:hypothetical protein